MCKFIIAYSPSDMVNKKILPKVIPKNETNQISLSKADEIDAVFEAGISYLTDALSVVVPPVGFIKHLREKRQEKKEAEIWKNLKNQLSRNTEDIANISTLLKNPKGFTLFNKVVFMVHSIELEDEDFSQYTELLAKILINISTKEFETLFSDVSYLISCVERLSPQALLLLSDSDNWPKGSVGGTTTSDVTLSGNWLELTTNEYLRSKNLDKKYSSKISHTFSELEAGGYMKVGSDKRIKKTKLGEELYQSLLNRI